MDKQLAQKLGHLAHDCVDRQYRRRQSNHALIIDQHLVLRGQKIHLGRREHADFRPATSSRSATIETGNHFRPSLDPYYATIQLLLQTAKEGRWWLEPSVPGTSRRPDLADVDLHQIWEVKPKNDAAMRAGRQQLRIFRRLLEQADREYRLLSRHEGYASDLGRQLSSKPWTYGVWVPVAENIIANDGTAFLINFTNEMGLILWDATKLH
ncbi:MAG: hypothetical protein Q8M16_11540 [Pirellulaceae bacterium]|nr:hypothetical protein [Pirellulaceae bacterium]